jgi:hypothetical protein
VEMYAGTTRTGHNSWPSTEPAISSMLDGLSYSLNVRGLSTAGQDAQPVNHLNVSGLPMPAEGESSPRGRQIQFYEAYRLFGEALQATGRNITYSICPYISGCNESIWSYYKEHAHVSMNQCPQEDNTDSWDSFILHIDDNNAFPGRADVAGPGYWNDLDVRLSLHRCFSCQRVYILVFMVPWPAVSHVGLQRAEKVGDSPDNI